jgi:pyridoxal phosphate-dependent aminotransferase EpsN
MGERVFLSAPDVSGREIEYIAQAIDDNWIGPLGPFVERFESELAGVTGVRRVLGLSSGTSAIHLALDVLGVERGDLVMASTFTFVGSVAPLRTVGADPWFVDSDLASWNMDPELLERAIAQARRKGRMPKAVIVVDIVGQCADYDPIRAICDAEGIPIIEDAAEALGATYRGRPAGSFGDVAILSFNGNKIMTTSTGGALLSDVDAYVDRAFFLATQARDPAPHYEHSETGYNYRMSSLLAAFGLAQLEALPDKVARRRAIFDRYADALGDLPGITFMPEADYGVANRWLTALLIDAELFGATNDELMAALAEENIESRPLWKPMHMQPVFAGADRTLSGVSERLFREGVCLPSSANLREDQQEVVVGVVREMAGR